MQQAMHHIPRHFLDLGTHTGLVGGGTANMLQGRKQAGKLDSSQMREHTRHTYGAMAIELAEQLGISDAEISAATTMASIATSAAMANNNLMMRCPIVDDALKRKSLLREKSIRDS
jgi:hypothetical protein